MNHRPAKLLLDEHVWVGLAAALQELDFDVIHVTLTPYRGIDDERLLEFAVSQSRAILTNNHRDFVPLARHWFETGKAHKGIILSVQLPRGELLRQTKNLLDKLPAEHLHNTVRWLQEFK
ncbi:MAG TPA: DUF5615 family PIN-like protein [Chloroflexota bacterium]|nr:DUF5615 family PIN-like protein [Chloroflexota bacterium]HUM69917.1 DUF5615 family PIN-like protein [Chloroflexota bacterium]